MVALRAGSSGFLTKEIEPDELRRAVKAVAAGNGWRPALFAIVSKPSSWSYETGARPAEGVSIIEMNLETIDSIRLLIDPSLTDTLVSGAIAWRIIESCNPYRFPARLRQFNTI